MLHGLENRLQLFWEGDVFLGDQLAKRARAKAGISPSGLRAREPYLIKQEFPMCFQEDIA